MKAVRDIALKEINALEPEMSEASRHEIAAVLQAHVNEMSSSAFTHLARVYFPAELQSTKKPENPVDPVALARIRELDAQIHAAEQRIHAHQTSLPVIVRQHLQASFTEKAKALEDALSSLPHATIESDTAIQYSKHDIAAVKATFARVRAKSSFSLRLTQPS
ncbi:hypothetical protein DYB32_007236 [Aphanomyces invadans]|uniref:Uncharacterized protein n=1 Tax=Aphanomyces invadans TaxID=157072 RepID=A0A3R6Y5G2_9STRA|nr:hypothetical protein DYB32_007236 [Aphanomyces invadans]